MSQGDLKKSTEEEPMVCLYSHPLFGRLIGYFLKSNEVSPNLYVVVAEPEEILEEEVGDEEDCPYQALITGNNEIIVDFLKMDLLEYFESRDQRHLCFTFTMEDGLKRNSFHVLRDGENYSLGGRRLTPSVPDNFYFQRTKYPEYWICTCINSFGIPELQVYSLSEERLVSNVFHEIEFVQEETGYFAYAQKYIYDIDPEDPDMLVSYTSVFGYLKEDFLFATDLYETTSEELISTRSFRSIQDFDRLEEKIKDKMYWKYKLKLERVSDAHLYMLEHPNPSFKPKAKQKEASSKVISFPNYK